ncbi:hypothetical protein [Acidisoma silvae]|uniref:Uncharacterized protein n=1 Tax=Acidisoma silvae TaxID=2802396 RepID=A0A964E0L2_9PROT|nr:hypothetical protein [Acidisoma silvae]MCB8877277.1 hypothetical protein [Acidisoma silvae]
MSQDKARAYADVAAAKLGLPLSEAELQQAAERVVSKQVDFAPLHAAAKTAPIEGELTFQPASAQAGRHD